MISLARFGLIAIVVALAPLSAAAQGRPAMVTTETVVPRVLSETLPVFGTVVASSDSDVAAQVSGVVERVAVLVGDEVETGDVLAELNTELSRIEYQPAEAGLAEAEAGMAIAEARLNQARDAFARIQGLEGTAAFSAGRFDDAEAALAEARGALAEAEARRLSAEAVLGLRRYNLDKARIVAPFPGTVLSVEADLGQFLASGAAVARLLDTASLEVEASVPSQYVAALRRGLEVDGQTEDGEPMRLTVRAILPTESATTRTRPVRFTTDFNGSARPVAVEQSITVSIPVSLPREVLAVPKDALVQAPGGWSVFVNAEGVAQPRPVEIGVAMGDGFEVLGGLAPGDEVVVRGNERLFPGQPINPMPAGAAN